MKTTLGTYGEWPSRLPNTTTNAANSTRTLACLRRIPTIAYLMLQILYGHGIPWPRVKKIQTFLVINTRPRLVRRETGRTGAQGLPNGIGPSGPVAGKMVGPHAEKHGDRFIHGQS